VSDDKEVTIVIRGKNLTDGEFAAVRKNIAGVGEETTKFGSLTDGIKSKIGGLGPLIAGAFSVAAIKGAVSSYIDFTGRITDLSAKTGIGAEALQRLKYAAEQNGGSLEQVTGAVTKLGQKLAGDDKSAVGALNALGLSIDGIRSASPDHAFTTIADAIAKIPDPMAQSKLAMDLFGKSGADLLPMMKGNLSETAAEAERLGIVMSQDAVDAGDKFGDSMHALGLVGQSVMMQVLQPMIQTLTTVALWLGDKLPSAVRFIVDSIQTGFVRSFLEARLKLNEFLLGVAEGINSIPLLGEKIGFSASTIKGLRGDVQQAKDTLAIFDEQTIAVTRSTDTQTQSIAKLKLNYGDNETAARKLEQQIKKNEEAQKKFTEAIDYFGVRANYATYNVLQPYAAALSDAGAKADILEATLPPLASSTTIATRAIEEAWRATGKYVEMTGTAATKTGLFGGDLDNLGNTILRAFQGGGDVLKSIGASIGLQLGENVVGSFGGSITKHLPSFLGNAINSIIPGLGSLLAPLASKIGGFFKNLFGGIPDDVKRARVDVDQFQASLAATLTAQQQAEAGGEKWKMTVIAVRDAYLAAGRTAGEAEAIVRQLWDTDHPDRARRALEEINRVLDQQKSKFGALEGEVLDAAGAIEREFRGRAIPALEDMYDAIDAVNFGHSPGGLKEIPILASAGALAVSSLRAAMVENFAAAESALDGFLEKFGKFSGGVPLDTFRAKEGEKPGPFEGYVNPNIDLISEADAAARARQVAAHYGVSLSDADLVSLANSYGYGGQGQLSKGRFESFLQELARTFVEGKFQGFATGTGGEFLDFGRGTPIIAHHREAIVPYEQRIPTAQKWLGEMPINVHLTLNVAVDKNGQVRVLNDAAFIREVMQKALDSRQVFVPAVAISGRSR
jgi:hypothetical protein